MKPAETPTLTPLISLAKLLSVLLLATGILLASTMTMKASWLWVLAPVALLMLLDITSAPRGAHFSLVSFYGGLAATALAFNYMGLAPSIAPTQNVIANHAGNTCGSRGCGTTGGCGTGGCRASSGGGCSCSSGKTAKQVVAKRAPAPPVRPSPPIGNRPGTMPAPNRNVKANAAPAAAPTRPPGTAAGTAPVPNSGTPAASAVQLRTPPPLQMPTYTSPATSTAPAANPAPIHHTHTVGDGPNDFKPVVPPTRYPEKK